MLSLFAASLLAFTLPTAPLAPAAPAVARSTAPQMMDFFGGLQQGLAKVMAGSYDEAEVKGLIERQIKMKPCIMYSMSTCPFCSKAKEAITSMGSLYTVVELDEEDNGMAIKAELAVITGQTSVPQVFIGGEFIGGCNDGGIGGVMPLKSTGERLAAKVLHDTSELAVTDLRSESSLLSHVRHPNVLQCMFTGTSPEGGLFIVTPLLATVLSAALPKSIDDVGFCARMSQVKKWPLARAVRVAKELKLPCAPEHRQLSEEGIELRPGRKRVRVRVANECACDA